MIKLFKIKIIMTLATAVTIGAVSTKPLLMISQSTSIKSPQIPNIKTIIANSKNQQGSNLSKSKNLLSDEREAIDNSKNNSENINKNEVAPSTSTKSSTKNNTNKKTTTNSNLKETNNTTDTNKKITTSPKLEEPNNTTTIDNQTTTNSKLEESNNNNQSNTNTTPEITTPTINYDRTTSIYANDNITLLRVEYYKNNKLTYYSSIEQFDATTKSYTEKIYQCNHETNIDPLIRTDIYVNGNLVKTY